MADNPYQKPPLTGYNANPPPDDGSQTTPNLVEWAKHVQKLGDPLRNYADDQNNATESAFGQTINIGADQNNILQGGVAFQPGTPIVIAGDAITPTGRSQHLIDTEAAAPTDDLNEMLVANCADGTVLLLSSVNNGRVITVKHNAGGTTNPFMLEDDKDYILDNVHKTLMVQRRGTVWVELSRIERRAAITNVVFAPFTSSTSALSGILPVDNTIPQNTEGSQVMNASITPTKLTSEMIISVGVNLEFNGGTGAIMAVALFKDNVADALSFNWAHTVGNNLPTYLHLQHVDQPNTLQSTEYKVRIGAAVGGNYRMNVSAASPVGGGVTGSSIQILERTS